MRIQYKRPFAQFVKKSRKPLQLAIEDVVMAICKNPEIGEQKIGDLQDFCVYKFRFNSQKYLVAYQHGIDEESLKMLWIDFYKVASHEYFYAELKKFIY